jgi:hypothetical protein
MLKGQGYWMIYDAAGGLWKLNLITGEATNVLSFHSGAISGIDASPNRHLIATTGQDGTIRM